MAHLSNLVMSSNVGLSSSVDGIIARGDRNNRRVYDKVGIVISRSFGEGAVEWPGHREGMAEFRRRKEVRILTTTSQSN
jgi:hypothetical protein